MKYMNLFLAGLMLGFAIEEAGHRRWKEMCWSLAIFAGNSVLAVIL